MIKPALEIISMLQLYRHSVLGFDVFSQKWPILLLLKCPYFKFFWIENTAYWIKFHVLGVINYVLGLKFFRDNPRTFWGLQQASDSSVWNTTIVRSLAKLPVPKSDYSFHNNNIAVCQCWPWLALLCTHRKRLYWRLGFQVVRATLQPLTTYTSAKHTATRLRLQWLVTASSCTELYHTWGFFNLHAWCCCLYRRPPLFKVLIIRDYVISQSHKDFLVPIGI